MAPSVMGVEQRGTVNTRPSLWLKFKLFSDTLLSAIASGNPWRAYS